MTLQNNVFTEGDVLYDMHMAEAVRYAADTGAHVLCLCGPVRSYNPDWHDAILYARAKGCTIVVPACNGNTNMAEIGAEWCPTYPALLPEVITVGATNWHNTRCVPYDWGWKSPIPYDPDFPELYADYLPEGSNFGWAVDVMAPSRTRWTTHPGNAAGDQNALQKQKGPWTTEYWTPRGDELKGKDRVMFGTGGGTSAGAWRVGVISVPAPGCRLRSMPLPAGILSRGNGVNLPAPCPKE